MNPTVEPALTPAPQSLIAAVERADTAGELLAATRALAAVMAATPDPASLSCLVEVLGFNNPGAAVAAVDGLIAAGAAAVEPLLANLDEHNYGARAWAVRALAGIGDIRGVNLLEQALGDDIGPSVRRAAARGLGQLKLEGLGTGERQRLRERCLTALEAACADGEWVVRYAVVVGLESLVGPLPSHEVHHHRARTALRGLGQAPQEPVPVVRLRADQALRRLMPEGIDTIAVPRPEP